MLWNNWLFLALLAPFMWALVNIIDAYFVKGIYEDEYDGTIISGLFQLVPWLAVPFIGIAWTSTQGVLLAVAGGFLFILSNFFYFRALFHQADAALILIVWGTVGIVVPGTEALMGERLMLAQYVGIGLAFIGAALLTLNGEIRRRNFGKVVCQMFWAVILCSGSMILEDRAFELLSFWDGLLFISLGSALASCFFWAIRPGEKKNGHILLAKKYFGIFLVAEGLALAGIIINTRAISVGPVSLVSAIGNIQPAWIMLIGLAIYLIAKIFGFGQRKSIRSLHRDQIVGWPVKVVAMTVIAVGVYLIG